MRRPVLMAVFLLSGAGAARAQDRAVILSGESRAAAGRIETVRQALAGKKWGAALGEIQTLLETSGDDLAPLGPDRAVQARLVCHRLLADLPPEVLRLYRGRAEAQARKWLEQGLAERDVRLLRRVVDEAFCTRAAERALDALGDLAFERGRFDEAELWWRTLTPLTPAEKRDLAYPDPETDAARTRAKQLLARLFRDDPRWDDDLAAYRQLHPEAAGKLAGRSGKYADVLKSVAEGLRQPERLAESEWSTFGGDPSRGLLLPATARQLDRLGALCRRPTWRFKLDSHVRIDEPALPPQWDGGDRKSARLLAFHPIFAGDKVFIADAASVTAFDLSTGRDEELYSARAQPGVTLTLPAPPDLRYTLTVADDCVLVRLGTQEVRAAKKEDAAASSLACLDLKPGPGGKRLRWTLRAAPQDASIFEGAPAAQDGQVFVAATRCTADLTITAVQCYALEAKGTPPLCWSHDVCETHELQGGNPRRRHHLLTLAGPNVVYCSHSGAVVALDALTGRRTWAVRYPVLPLEVGPELPGIDKPPLRDLAPCLYAAGRLFVAPSDSDRLLCLDPLTGRTCWERKVFEIVHLLGVGRGRLIFTTGGGLRAVDAATGADVWATPDDGELSPMGRGLLLGDLVLWPTPRGVLLVRQEDGRLAEDVGFLHSVPKGNLAFAHGCLVVADRTTLTVFAPPAKYLRERRNDAEREPESAAAALELGGAEADAGQYDAAVKSLETAERLAKREPALREEARATRHSVLMAASKFAAAAGAEFTLSMRVRAQQALAEQRERGDDPAGAVAAWQVLIEDERLSPMRVTGTGGLPRTAGQLAAETIGTLLKKHGPTAYLAVEKRARARFEAAPKGEERAAALERLTVEFPNADVRRVVLRELVDLYSNSHRYAALTHACGRLRADPGPEDDVAALRRRAADAIERLSWSAFPARLPLYRSWQVALDPDEGMPAGAERMAESIGYKFVTVRPCSAPSSGGWLRCRVSKTGELSWQTPLPFVPEWVAVHLHVILIGGRHGVAAVRLDDGQLVWTFSASASHFHEAFGRLFFLEDGRLLAIDIWRGMVVWQREAPGAGLLPTLGRFYPHYYADNENILIQTATGRRWLLDAKTGRTLGDEPSPEPWPVAPLSLDEKRVLLVEDSHRVVMLDLETGREVWTTMVAAPSAISGVPTDVLAWEKTLLVLTQTNLGPRLQRLDAATGKPLWHTMPLLPSDTSDKSEWGHDEDTVYLAQGHKLIALDLADGKQRWETTLAGPAGSWRTRREGNFLLAWPANVTEWRFQFRSPFGAVQWGIAVPPEERPGAGCPLIALDPATGRIVQRWNFPAGPMRLRSYPAETATWPVIRATHERGDAGLTVISARSGLVATVGGRAWGLRTMD